MRFNYLEPVSVEEAVSLLMKYDGKAKVLAGGTDLLVQIRNKIEHQLNQIGILSEGRKFHPHVTLGRVKENKIKGMGDYITQYALFHSDTVLIDNFVLFSSKLTPKGAIYTKEMTYPLDKR